MTEVFVLQKLLHLFFGGVVPNLDVEGLLRRLHLLDAVFVLEVDVPHDFLEIAAEVAEVEKGQFEVAA